MLHECWEGVRASSRVGASEWESGIQWETLL